MEVLALLSPQLRRHDDGVLGIYTVGNFTFCIGEDVVVGRRLGTVQPTHMTIVKQYVLAQCAMVRAVRPFVARHVGHHGKVFSAKMLLCFVGSFTYVS